MLNFVYECAGSVCYKPTKETNIITFFRCAGQTRLVWCKQFQTVHFGGSLDIGGEECDCPARLDHLRFNFLKF